MKIIVYNRKTKNEAKLLQMTVGSTNRLVINSN